MPGPRTPDEALAWAREALAAGRYWTPPHFEKRMRERRITLADARHAIEHATQCVPYDGRARQGGTCWRIHGPTLDEDDDGATVGVEVYRDPLTRLTLVTLF